MGGEEGDLKEDICNVMSGQRLNDGQITYVSSDLSQISTERKG